MALFTFVTDYRGGTYIRQVQANNLRKACEIWADAIVQNDNIYGLKLSKFLKAAAAELAEFSPTPIEGATNVWCFSLAIGKKLMLVNIIKTEKARKTLSLG